MTHSLGLGYSAFFEVHKRFGPGFSDHSRQKFRNAGVVPNHHHCFVPRVFVEHLAEIGKRGFGPERRLQLQLTFRTEFVANQ